MTDKVTQAEINELEDDSIAQPFIKSDGKIVDGNLTMSFEIKPVPVKIATDTQPTPRTDVLAKGMIDRPMTYDGMAVWDHAKKLERELAQCQADLAAANAMEAEYKTKYMMITKEVLDEREAREYAERKFVIADKDRRLLSQTQDVRHDECSQREAVAIQRAEAAELRADQMFERTKARCRKVCDELTRFGSFQSKECYRVIAACVETIDALTPESPERGEKEQGMTDEFDNAVRAADLESARQIFELRSAQMFFHVKERCANVLDALHEKISDGWGFYSDERSDGAHNTLTNGAKAIRALAPSEKAINHPVQRRGERPSI